MKRIHPLLDEKLTDFLTEFWHAHMRHDDSRVEGQAAMAERGLSQPIRAFLDDVIENDSVRSADWVRLTGIHAVTGQDVRDDAKAFRDLLFG